MKHKWGPKENLVGIEDEEGIIYDLYKCMYCGLEYRRYSLPFDAPLGGCKGHAEGLKPQ